MEIILEIKSTNMLNVGSDSETIGFIKQHYESLKANPSTSNAGALLRAAAALNQNGLLNESDAETALTEVEECLKERIGIVRMILNQPPEKRNALNDAVEAAIRAIRLIGPLGGKLTEDTIKTITTAVFELRLGEVFTVNNVSIII